MPASNWYYTQNGQSTGPVAAEAISAMLSQGTLGPNDLVWRDGMSQWAAISSIPEFAGASIPMSYAAPQPMQQSPYAQQEPYAPGPGYGYGQPGTYPPPGYGYGQPGAYQAPLNYYAPTTYINYAGFWKRFAAALIDGIIMLVLMVPVALIVFAMIGFDRIDDEDTMVGLDLGFRGFGVFVGWLYSAFMESSKYQGTLGKMALGIKVTDMNGQPITFGRASGRHFGKILSACICYIGFMMAGWTERKQALHDQMAGCLVVNR